MRLRLVLVLAVLSLAGCGGSSQGSVFNDGGMLTADWLVVDLSTGAAEPRHRLDPADPALRDRLMAFRRVPAGRFTPGVAGAFIGDGDEKNLAEEAVPEAWLAVFEVTAAQWARLTDGAVPATGGDLPAAIRRSELEAALAQQAGRGRHFALPSRLLWEYAASAGTGQAFAWGDALLEGDARLHAVFDPQAGSTLVRPTGPAAVGSRLGNSWGLFDMHGNLWEHVRGDEAEHEIRGGSWAQPLVQARSSNRVLLPYDTNHPLVGARLTWSE